MWNWSFPACFTMYLLAQIRPASRASLDNCSYSFETRWIHVGKVSTGIFFDPKSKILILESGVSGGGRGGVTTPSTEDQVSVTGTANLALPYRIWTWGRACSCSICN